MNNHTELLTAIGIVVLVIAVFFAIMAVSSLIVPFMIVSGGVYFVYILLQQNKD